MSATIKVLLLILLLSSILVILVTLLFCVHFTPYTNLSQAQVWDQEDRWFSEQAHACQHVGGTWQAGFSTAGCNVQYPLPDDSWYITPVENPWYTWWPILIGLILIVGMVLCAVLISHLCVLLKKIRQTT